MSDIHVTGLPELQKFLDQLAPKIERNVARGALRAGATQELLPEVQANVLQNGSIKSRQYIAGLKVGTRARGGKVISYVKASGPHAYLAAWLEWGVAAHNIAAKHHGWLSFMNVFRKEVAHPGIKPRAHFRPALDRSGGAAVLAAAQYMRTRLSTKEGLDASHVMLPGDE